jgi:hypothetical protein
MEEFSETVVLYDAAEIQVRLGTDKVVGGDWYGAACQRLRLRGADRSQRDS